MTTAFDIIAAIHRLEDAGLSREAAEAIAAAGQGAPATKADLDASLSAFEARMTWRIVGFVIAANAVPVAAVKLLP